MPETEPTSQSVSPRREAPTPVLASTPATARPASVTIGLPIAEVYAFTRDFGNFPKFMRGVKNVETTAAGRARFTFTRDGEESTCEVERLSEIQDTLVSWQTVGDSAGESACALSLEPAPGDRGTVVSLRLDYDHEVRGKVKGMLSYFTGHDPKNEAYVNLRRLKAYLETGEVPTIQGQPSGRDQ